MQEPCGPFWFRQRAWITVKEHARHIGRSVRTVTRRIDAGELEVRHECGVRMIRIATI